MTAPDAVETAAVLAEPRLPAPRFLGEPAPAKPRWVESQRSWGTDRKADERGAASARALNSAQAAARPTASLLA
jgi:hypothetical protein